MSNNDTKTITENPIQKINDFLKLIGFSDEKIAEHHQRLSKLIFIEIADDLDKLSQFKEKEPFPKELKSLDDFVDYYAKYVDKETIGKIIQEKYYKFYSEYLGAIGEKIKDLDNL